MGTRLCGPEQVSYLMHFGVLHIHSYRILFPCMADIISDLGLLYYCLNAIICCAILQHCLCTIITKGKALIIYVYKFWGTIPYLKLMIWAWWQLAKLWKIPFNLLLWTMNPSEALRAIVTCWLIGLHPLVRSWLTSGKFEVTKSKRKLQGFVPDY